MLLDVQVPLVASNRIGTETFEHSHITFYGGSFIAGPSGEVVAQARRVEQALGVGMLGGSVARLFCGAQTVWSDGLGE